jgi:hypothetical protein
VGGVSINDPAVDVFETGVLKIKGLAYFGCGD